MTFDPAFAERNRASTERIRLTDFPTARLEELVADDPRWVVRALHRGVHLDEIDAALER